MTTNQTSMSDLLIKGYLPVRVKFSTSASCTSDDKTVDETFFYIKEHRNGNDTRGKAKGTVLFVSNAPSVPGVKTMLILKALLGRFGDILRVTVVPNPAHQKQRRAATYQPSFLATPPGSVGTFAHVVFSGPRDLRKTVRALENLMGDTSINRPGLDLGQLEIQTLADASVQQEELEEPHPPDSSSSAVRQIAETYRKAIQRLDREEMLQECNKVISQFEVAEEALRLAKLKAANQEADNEGFITVPYSSIPGGDDEGQKPDQSQHQRRKSQKRSRHDGKNVKKKGKLDGSASQEDFYRFQTKEKRQSALRDLRRRFEDDMAKVKQRKEERRGR